LRKLRISFPALGLGKRLIFCRVVVTVPVDPLRDQRDVAVGVETRKGPLKVIAIDTSLVMVIKLEVVIKDRREILFK
jgi:hypothetical protein